MWDKIEENIARNVEIYRKVFGCYPDDTIRNFKDVKILKKNSKIDLYDELKDQIRGYAVNYPLDFLSGENLSKSRYFSLGISIIPKQAFV